MINIELPTWLQSEDINRLKNAAQAFWVTVTSWVEFPLTQFNELDVSVFVLNLLAWERGIERVPNEPLSLYRDRVRFALVNAQDAGSVVGLIRIFERLGVNIINVRERIDGLDFDIVSIDVEDTQLAENANLMNAVIRSYGRTCRRYQFTVTDIYEEDYAVFSAEYDNQSLLAVDSLFDEKTADIEERVALFDFSLNNANFLATE